MRVISLTKGKTAIVDDCDFDLVSKYKWYAWKRERNWYALTNIRNPHSGKNRQIGIRMHRLILGFPKSGIDHKNHNGLDNRRSNLRACSQSENNGNNNPHKNGTKSRHKGITLHTNGRWRARIGFQNKRISLGVFESNSEAIGAYVKASEILFPV